MAAKSSRWFPLMISVFVIILRKAEAAPADSLVTSLPGFNGTFPSRHYSGYVSLKKEKNMFYYMIESERNPKDDPVVLWLNGGPGCSSFDGFVYEHGPFNFEQGKVKGSLPKLHLNPFSWSKVSNMIYLDSPCGVGLSYSPNASNYETDDHQTALDSHEFLLKWFQVYPEFQQNPFYISGESYAGIYVPTLSAQVVQGIKGAANPTINFKGYLVGNGVSNDEKTDGLGAFVHFVHGMALISDQMFQHTHTHTHTHITHNIVFVTIKISFTAQAVSKLNIYDILEPCYHDPEGQMEKQPKLPTSFQQLGNTERPLKVRKRMFGRAWPLWREHFTNFRGNSSTSNNMPLWPQLARKAGGVMCVVRS
ncbi:Serine carboxypeptidase 1 [Linum perenne]